MKREKKAQPRSVPWEMRKGTPVKQDHHIRPRSRGGSHNKNILEGIPSDLHYSYHRLFGNLIPQEVLQVLLLYFFKPGKFKKWRKIINGEDLSFKHLTPDQLINLLILRVFPQDWIPGDKLMREFEKRRNQGKS